ncbi:MAG TPA: hypothetical protein VIC35_05590 [Acidimicrobiia bacterium]
MSSHAWTSPPQRPGAQRTPQRLRSEALTVAIVFGAVLAVLAAVRAQPFSRPQLWAQPLDGWPRPFYAGSLWLAEVAFVLAASASALAVARRRSTPAPTRAFLSVLAAVSAVIALDDLFQLHDPRVSGLPSYVILGFEIVVIGALLATQRRTLAQHDIGLLVVTLAAASLWLFAKGSPTLWQHTAIESGSKFAAMIGWGTYVLRAAQRAAHREPIPGRSP